MLTLYTHGLAHAHIRTQAHQIFNVHALIFLSFVLTFCTYLICIQQPRRDLGQIYQHVLRHQKATSVKYFSDHSEILFFLVDGYVKRETGAPRARERGRQRETQRAKEYNTTDIRKKEKKHSIHTYAQV